MIENNPLRTPAQIVVHPQRRAGRFVFEDAHMRTRKMRKDAKLNGKMKEVEESYESGLSIREISDKHMVSINCVWLALKRNGVKIRTPKEQVEICSRLGKLQKNRDHRIGEVKISSYGYRLIRNPWHPSSFFDGYVPEHIMIMEDILGHPMENGMVVHHINQIKTDNSPSNLCVMSKGSHTVLHKTGTNKTEKKG